MILPVKVTLSRNGSSAIPVQSDSGNHSHWSKGSSQHSLFSEGAERTRFDFEILKFVLTLLWCNKNRRVTLI